MDSQITSLVNIDKDKEEQLEFSPRIEIAFNQVED
jgi:hypothetical protein